MKTNTASKTGNSGGGEKNNRRGRRGGRRGGGGRGGHGGRGRGQGRGRGRGGDNGRASTPRRRGKVLVLHGNRQTGTILTGRMDKLRKRLEKMGLEFVAPDAPFPHPEDTNLCQWWERQENSYIGLEQSLNMLDDLWECNNRNHTDNNDNNNDSAIVGVLGFSQGARLAHLIAMIHHYNNNKIMEQSSSPTTQDNSNNHNKLLFPGLQFVIMASGYDRPMPDELIIDKETGFLVAVEKERQDESDKNSDIDSQISINVPSLHVWGALDKLIPVDESRAVIQYYQNPQTHQHDQGHCVSMRADAVNAYIQFIEECLLQNENRNSINPITSESTITTIDSSTTNKRIPIETNTASPPSTVTKDIISASTCKMNAKTSNTNSSSVDTNPITKATKTSSNSAPSTSTTSTTSIDTIKDTSTIADNTLLIASKVDKQNTKKQQPQEQEHQQPDEESALTQQEEVEALQAIFPEEVTMLSKVEYNEDGVGECYEHPITYQIALHPTADGDDEEEWWPPRPIALRIRYPHNYPVVSPAITLQHENNVMEFSYNQMEACLGSIKDAAETEKGMPCVLSCVYAAREFFESGAAKAAASVTATRVAVAHQDDQHQQKKEEENNEENGHNNSSSAEVVSGAVIKSASMERVQQCNLQGQEIAQTLLGRQERSKNGVETNATTSSSALSPSGNNNTTTDDGSILSSSNKGGVWIYTIGLVGKPSAGKSTFFNAATAFARQRNNNSTSTIADSNNNAVSIGGASMAPHPFTTIDPIIGCCLIPAPKGSCPEEDYYSNKTDDNDNKSELNFGCTHGRDSYNRRLIPVLLKDVAGLVPGAYQGRGKGNKFLHDLTDADVLIHVVDASGTADEQGNSIIVHGDDDDDDDDNHGKNDRSTNNDNHTSSLKSQPLQDLAWIQNELIEWIFTNLLHKWDTIKRKGRSKLSDMFSGYGQTQNVTWDILNAVEKYMGQQQQELQNSSSSLDDIYSWDTGDVHRLVSAFLGVRFPMALALNKCDLPSSKQYVQDILHALPIYGAHVGIPLSAREEMSFVRDQIIDSLASSSSKSMPSPPSSNTSKKEEKQTKQQDLQPPPPSPLSGVWECLQSSIMLKEPILVFPVSDMTTYLPLPGMIKYATGDPSLPNRAMISCLEGCSGTVPSLWDGCMNNGSGGYSPSRATTTNNNNSAARTPRSQQSSQHTTDTTSLALRDVLVMKPRSTVEDVFIVLKRLGALSGEFVRAEGSGQIGEKPKLIPKHEIITKNTRILKIMTNKRTAWQQQQ